MSDSEEAFALPLLQHHPLPSSSLSSSCLGLSDSGPCRPLVSCFSFVETTSGTWLRLTKREQDAHWAGETSLAVLFHIPSCPSPPALSWPGSSVVIGKNTPLRPPTACSPICAAVLNASGPASTFSPHPHTRSLLPLEALAVATKHTHSCKQSFFYSVTCRCPSTVVP